MKRFRIIILFFISFLICQKSFSQTLIKGEDTVCINNYLQLSTTDTTASSYYWGFCSAYLNNIPTGSSIAAGTVSYTHLDVYKRQPIMSTDLPGMNIDFIVFNKKKHIKHAEKGPRFLVQVAADIDEKVQQLKWTLIERCV